MTTKTPEIRIIGRCTLDTEAILRDMPAIIYAETVYIKEEKASYKAIWSDHYQTVYMQLKKKTERSMTMHTATPSVITFGQTRKH